MNIQKSLLIISKLTVILALFAFMAHALNERYLSVADGEYNLYEKTDFSQDKYKNIKIIVSGDSHSGGILSKKDYAINIYNAGESYIQRYYKLKYLIERRGLKAEYVILPLDLHTFSSNNSTRFLNNPTLAKHINFYEIYKITGNKDYLANYFIFRFAFVGNWREIFGIKYEREKREWKTPQDKERLLKQKINMHFGDKIFFDDVKIEYFKKTIALLQENKMKVILVKYPVRSDYYDMAMEFDEIQKYDQTILPILDQFGEIPVLDYQKEYYAEPDLFVDEDHMYGPNKYLLEDGIIKDLKKMGLITE